MPDVPGIPTRNHDLRFNGRLARLAAGREEFVEVEVAVEAEGGVAVVSGSFAGFLFGEGNGEVGGTGIDAGEAGGARGVGFGVEGDAFEGADAVVAGEAVGVEALRGGCDRAAGDGKGAGGTLGGGALRGGGPVWGGSVDGGCGGVVGERAVGGKRARFWGAWVGCWWSVREADAGDS